MEVCWLSRGKRLERLFNLKSYIILFFKTYPHKDSEELISALEDHESPLDLAFLCDITEMLNNLNLTLQGKNIKIFQLNTILNNFCQKLDLLIYQLKNNSIVNLTKISLIFAELNFNNIDKIKKYAEIVESLRYRIDFRI